MRLLDLFSGIGGFSLGLERAGFETVAFCEVSPVCRHLLAHHWPKVPCYDDIRTLTAERLAADGVSVDAICGGFPCQDISFAGAGAGLSGERSGLFWQIVRLVRELCEAGRKPRFLFLENVAALLSRGLGDVLGALAALGYDLWWDCIPAAAVGAPHRRDRLWIVAYARGEQHEGYGDALRRAVAAGLSAPSLADSPWFQPRWAEQWAEWERAGKGRESELCCDRQPYDLGLCAGCEDFVAYAKSVRWCEGWAKPAGQQGRSGVAGCGASVGDAEHGRRQGRHAHGTRSGATLPSSWWLSEPAVGRVAHGVPARVDRLHALGNAVVPQIPEILGRAALAALQQARAAA